MAYTQILRRIRNEKTNYTKRKNMLIGKKDFITIQISNENIQVQIHKPDITGDKVLASSHSRFLLNKNWKGSRKNIPASYLTGYLTGKKALAKGISNAIVYSGTRKYTQRMAAAVKGVVDSGLEVPVSSESFPIDQRINGEHLKIKNDITAIKSQIDSEIKTE